MPNQPSPVVQNHFQAGLKTEFTGLNFPENAATDTENCVFNYVGDVFRRGGIDIESGGFPNQELNFAGVSRSSYRWFNAGGDGESQILVVQVGFLLYFYLTSSATDTQGISLNLIQESINLNSFNADGNIRPNQQSECQYTSGNGYLFVFHPNCDPFYVTYTPAVAGQSLPSVVGTRIQLKIRDTIGIPENVDDSFRPQNLTNEHFYNLLNQGWTQGSGWTGTGVLNTGGAVPCVGNRLQLTIQTQSSSSVLQVGNSIQVQMPQLATIGANNGNNNFSGFFIATINAIGGLGLSVTCTSINYNCSNTNLGFWSGGNFVSLPNESVNFTLLDEGFINAWNTAFMNWPSNADVWWLYKDTSGNFNSTSLATTFPNVQALTSPAPKGHNILAAFQLNRSAASSISNLTNVLTTVRPSTGAWYASRVFYAGVNSSQVAQGDEPYNTWTENIYFSQIIEHPTQFGLCYQNNDPTSENLNALLPSDGGVLTIQGCGAIYKLFALRFGLLVFAANGIWFISGSSAIGFTANDFTVTKISNIQAISGTSFIDVLGYPFFWNQEGIYQVVPATQAGSAHSPDIQLDVQNLTLGTILSYYNQIPNISKTFARGDYNAINYVIQWCFRSTPETDSFLNRYSYDTILNYNTLTKAFYPWTIPAGNTTIANGQFTIDGAIVSDVKYINTPGGAPQGVNTAGNVNSGELTPGFRYILQVPGPYNAGITFGQERDPLYVDFRFFDGVGKDYTSYFVTGFSLPGQALRKIQIPYIYLFSRNNNGGICSIQAIWDFVNTVNSGKESPRQIVTMGTGNSIYRKIRLRGRGLAAQIKVSSLSGQAFDIMGWSVLNEVNTGI